LLNAFWKEVGTDNDDYKPGYTCQPSDEWISWLLIYNVDEKILNKLHQKRNASVLQKTLVMTRKPWKRELRRNASRLGKLQRKRQVQLGYLHRIY